MDEKLPNPEVVESSGFKQKKDLEKLFRVVLLTLAILLLLAGGYYLLSQKKSVSQTSPPPVFDRETQTESAGGSLDKIIVQVGLENLYQADLDYYLSTYFAGQGYTPKDQALEKMIDDSIILQEGQKNGYISLNNAVFNSQSKNIASRSALIEPVRQKLADRNLAQISGEVLSIWFNNPSYPEPKIGVGAAKKIASGKINQLYQDLKAGRTSFDQAASRCQNDGQLASIAPSYKSNAS